MLTIDRSEAKILFLSALPALGIFIIFSILYDTPLIHDDYRYLNASLSENFRFSDLGPFISRSPFFAVMLYILLKLDFLQSSFWFFLNLFFVFHVLTVGLVTLYFIKLIAPEEFQLEKKYKIILIFLIAILSFYPNFIELILWPHAASFFIGGFLMAIGIFSRSAILKTVLFFCAYATYETFIIPSILLAIIPHIINFNPSAQPFSFRFKSILREGLIFLIAVSAFFVTRYILANIYGSYSPVVESPTWYNFMRIIRYLHTIYYHTTILENRIEISVLVIILLFAVSKRLVHLGIFAVLLILLILSGIHDIIIPYEGYRVIYGTFLIRCAIIAIGLLLAIKYTRTYFALPILLLLFIAYIPSHIRTWKIRTYDHAVLVKYQSQMERMMKSSSGGVTIALSDYAKNLRPYDWVVPSNSQYFLDFFKTKINIDKPVNFIFLNSKEKHLPIIFPANHLEINTGKIVSDPLSFSGDAVLLYPDSIENYIQTPFVKLDSGNYTAICRVKTGNLGRSPKKNFHLEVLSQKDTSTLALTKFPMENLDYDNYKTIYLPFSIQGTVDSVALKIKQKQSWLIIDYLGLSKD